MKAVDHLADLAERETVTRTSKPHMFGVDTYIDDPKAVDYDPHDHAESLGVPLIYRRLPTPQMVACYSRRHNAIFIRPNLHSAVERCAVAHELVHFEYSDIGTTASQETRANRIAARRMIRPSVVNKFAASTDDPGVVALHLNVTETLMRIYIRALCLPVAHDA